MKRKQHKLLPMMLSILLIVAFMPSIVFAEEVGGSTDLKVYYEAEGHKNLGPSGAADKQHVGNPEIAYDSQFGIYRYGDSLSLSATCFIPIANDETSTVKVYETCGLNLTGKIGYYQYPTSEIKPATTKKVTIDGVKRTAYMVQGATNESTILCLKIVVSDNNKNSKEYQIVVAPQQMSESEILSTIRTSFAERMNIDKLSVESIKSQDQYNDSQLDDLWTFCKNDAMDSLNSATSVQGASVIVAKHHGLVNNLIQYSESALESLTAIKDAQFLISEAEENLANATDENEKHSLQISIAEKKADIEEARASIAKDNINIAMLKAEWTGKEEDEAAVETTKDTADAYSRSAELARAKAGALKATYVVIPEIESNLTTAKKAQDDLKEAYDAAEKTASFKEGYANAHGTQEAIKEAKEARAMANLAKREYLIAKSNYDELLAQREQAYADIAQVKAEESGTPEDLADAGEKKQAAERAGYQAKLSKAEADISKTVVELDEAVAAKEAAVEAQKQAEADKEAAENARDQAIADKEAAENARDQAIADKEAAENARDQAIADKEAAENARDQAIADKEAAENARDQAIADKEAAENARDQAIADKEAAENARDQAIADKEAAEKAKAQAEAERDAAKKALNESQPAKKNSSIVVGKVNNLKAKAGKKKVSVSWSTVPNASGYRVFRAKKKKGKYKLVGTVSNGKTGTYTDTNVKKGKKYFYKVQAFNTSNGITTTGLVSNIVKSKKVKK